MGGELIALSLGLIGLKHAYYLLDADKSEIRSTKSETNPNDQKSKFKTRAARGKNSTRSNIARKERVLFWSFCRSNFEFVSNFDIRISDFCFLPEPILHI